MNQPRSHHPVTQVIVPALTFFNADGEIAEGANRLLINHILKNSPNCLFILGSTGEGLYFQDKPIEREKYLVLVRSIMQEHLDIPVLIGIYGENSQEVITNAKWTLDKYPEAGLVIPPPVERKIDVDDQPRFYVPIFEALKCPIYLYNNPGTFGNTTIDIIMLSDLKKYPNFCGIKDSSGTLKQKKKYLELLSPHVTVSCGKEGMLADFLATIPGAERAMAGIVPSIANLVNTNGKIFEAGLNSGDDQMKALQKEMNDFRIRIYDSLVGTGKAQRGVKYAFSHLYRNRGIDIPLAVTPKLQRKLEETTKLRIEFQVDELVQQGHINTVE